MAKNAAKAAESGRSDIGLEEDDRYIAPSYKDGQLGVTFEEAGFISKENILDLQQELESAGDNTPKSLTDLVKQAISGMEPWEDFRPGEVQTVPSLKEKRSAALREAKKRGWEIKDSSTWTPS